jgi:hypothetical protein
MNTHYTLMQSAMPRDYVKPFIQACNDKMQYFITSEDLLGEDEAHPITKLNEIFDLSLADFKTIAIKINPYKRIALFYVYYKSCPVDPEYTNYTGCATLTEFLDMYLNTHNPTYYIENSVNASEYYTIPDSGITVSYLLEFDTFNTDVKTIPEFQNVDDVNYLAEAYAKLEGWKELYTDADKSRVAEVFATDIATWNYTF